MNHVAYGSDRNRDHEIVQISRGALRRLLDMLLQYINDTKRP